MKRHLWNNLCATLFILIESRLVGELSLICSIVVNSEEIPRSLTCHYKPDTVTRHRVFQHFDKGVTLTHTTGFCCLRFKSIIRSFNIHQHKQQTLQVTSLLCILWESVSDFAFVWKKVHRKEEERHPATDTFTDRWACSEQEAWLDGSSAVWVITAFWWILLRSQKSCLHHSPAIVS